MPELTELEARLTALAAMVEWPATPKLSAAVVRRVFRRRPVYQSRWALAAVAVIVLLSMLLAYPPTRTAIADFLNLHTIIRRTTTLPSPSPLPSGALGSGLGLGSPTTLSDAGRGVSWTVLVPNALGQPDTVYLQKPPDGPSLGEVTLVYGSRSGIPVSAATGVSVLVTEARGSVDENFFGKMLGPGTTLEDVSVDGNSGWWISGSPHEFFFIDASGQLRSETLRLATNTLILDVNGTIVRIEGDLTKAQALQIASSLS